MKYKICALLTAIILTFSLVGCGETNTDTIEFTSPETTQATEQTESTQATEQTETTVEPILTSREDYFNALYGYYESDDNYISISEDYYQEKNKVSGELVKEGELIDATLTLEDDNTVMFTFTFYQNADSKLYWVMDEKGNVATAHGIKLKKITKEEYDSVATKQPVTSVSTEEYPLAENEYVYTPPWYMELYDIYTLQADLQYIDNLLAVGNEAEALVEIESRIFSKLDTKVDELIKSREYWAAHNYIAMYNKHLGGYYRSECGYYYFLEEYFEETYTSDDAMYGISKRGFTDFTQKYYLQIINAVKTDYNYISKQDALYKINDYFLSIGESTRTNLWDTRYMYYTDNFDQNYDTTEFYIVCPYTQQIRYLPVTYYFLDGDCFYEAVLDDYM